jgi:predicted RecA/RadA family phage recombinase
MAKNQVYAPTKTRPLTCTQPATPASGDPVLCGQIPGVALIAENADGDTVCALDGAFNLSVQGETNADAGSAVAKGDILYYDSAETVKINKDTTGVRFGYALGTVGSGATATIPVEIGY